MIEKFEKKVNEIKEKIDKRICGVFLYMCFSAMTMFAFTMTNNFKIQKQLVQDEYNKSMYQVVSYMNNVEVELEKLEITSTDNLKITTLADIWRKSNLAKTNLESLPVTQDSLQNASKYLAQLSDFSYSVIKQIIRGEKITDRQYEDIAKMHDSSREFSNVLSSIYNDLNTGKIKWDELSKIGENKLEDTNISDEVSNIDKINKTFLEYEGLIYDGAFSNHILTQDPKYLSDKIVEEAVARESIYNIFDTSKVEEINYIGESSGRIELYNYDVKLKYEEFSRSVSITKKDAKLYLMLSDRRVLNENISLDEAKKAGVDFLNSIGYGEMVDTYYLKVENMAIINYVAKQNDVIMYPDLIKVKIALDTGEVLSVEAQGYIFNHTKRELEDLTPYISVDTAREKINNNIEIIKEDIAIIPTESMNEVLAYEFKGKVYDREFLVYINAKNGIEEKILLILDTPGGILTM